MATVDGRRHADRHRAERDLILQAAFRLVARSWDDAAERTTALFLRAFGAT